ncbi:MULTISPECIES: RNA polymerase sigma factor [unclassified Isoptericola]|uniref:RNA polymerase sigma factor n=1 Tax=unclassified Isoptericola TaxID=2623355 RepID=UPI0036568258
MTPGPEDVFSEVFRSTYPDVLGYLRRRVEHQVAEDLAAEVFTIAWDRWDSVPREVRPWLFGVARNLLADDRRRQGRRRRLELRAAAEHPLPEDDVASAAASMDLRLAWGRLGDADREVLALVTWDGLTGREAAQVLGCTRAAFSVRLTRARRRLRGFVGDVDAGPAASVPHPSPAPRPAHAVAPGGKP